MLRFQFKNLEKPMLAKLPDIGKSLEHQNHIMYSIKCAIVCWNWIKPWINIVVKEYNFFYKANNICASNTFKSLSICIQV